MVEAARAIQCIAHVYHSLHHFQACQTSPAAVNGGNAKTEEHHALDFPRISLANVGSGRRTLTLAMDLIAPDFHQG